MFIIILQLLFMDYIKPELARFGPRFSSGQKTLGVGPEEALTRHNQALEVTVETRLALALTSMHAFGPTVEIRLIIPIKSI